MFTGKGEKLGEAQVIQTDPVVGIEQREGIVHGFDRIDQAQAQALDALFVGLPCADVAKRDKGTQTVGAGDDRVFDGEILLPRSLLTGKAPGLHFLPLAPLETGADRASLAIGQNGRVVVLPSQAVGLDPSSWAAAGLMKRIRPARSTPNMPSSVVSRIRRFSAMAWRRAAPEDSSSASAARTCMISGRSTRSAE